MTKRDGLSSHRLLALAALVASMPWASKGASATVEIIHHFKQQPNVGRSPLGHLIELRDGRLYGITGASGQFNQGTIYRVKKDGSDFQAIHHFTRNSPGNGSGPTAGLLDGKDGFLYGTTETGSQDAYYGTIYRIKSDGTDYQTLRAFPLQPGGLRHPVASLRLCGDDRLYTVTRGGGFVNFGAVCSMNKDGSVFQILHLFQGGPGDGSEPISGLVEAKNGFLMGMTSSGGRSQEGTLYRLTKSGASYQVLFHFSTPNHGGVPYAELVEGEDGSWYGFTSTGGRSTCGSLFKVNPDGSGLEILQFLPGAPYGASQAKFPMTPLDHGRFVVVTPGGGRRGRGFIGLFQPGQSEVAPLHHFMGDQSDGEMPNGPLLLGSDGALYGVTWRGGQQGYGTLYRVRLAGL